MIINQETFVVPLSNGKSAILKMTPFDTDIDIDDLTTIHYHNIIGEIITCPAILNRIGNLLAEVDSILAETKLDFEIFFAYEEEKFRKQLTTSHTNTKGNIKIEPPTNTAVEQCIIRTPEYRVKKKHLISLQKQRDIVNSWYWAFKDKSDKVSRVTDKLRPEDFEKDIVEETINTIQIRKHVGALKQPNLK